MKNTDFRIEFNEGSKVSQIEKAALILYTLFGTLQSNAVSPEDDAKFQDEVFSMCQIGTAFVDSIWANISDFIEPDETDETEVHQSESLGVLLSHVLRHPDIPPELFGEIMQAVNDIHSNADRAMIDELETSPEMLSKIFEAYKANHDEE